MPLLWKPFWSLLMKGPHICGFAAMDCVLLDVDCHSKCCLNEPWDKPIQIQFVGTDHLSDALLVVNAVKSPLMCRFYSLGPTNIAQLTFAIGCSGCYAPAGSPTACSRQACRSCFLGVASSCRSDSLKILMQSESVMNGGS